MTLKNRERMTYKAVLYKIIPMMKKSNNPTRIKFASISEAVAYAILITKKKREKK